MATKISTKHVETLTHDEARRINIQSVEQQSFVQPEQTAPKQIRYPRNTDLDPQLVWRGHLGARSVPCPAPSIKHRFMVTTVLFPH